MTAVFTVLAVVVVAMGVLMKWRGVERLDALIEKVEAARKQKRQERRRRASR